jgi:hypothetical protein
MLQGPDPTKQPTERRLALPRIKAEQILTEFVQDREPYPAKTAERCLKDLLKHHLIQINGDQIEFRHQLIQEYFAAEKLLRLLPDLSDEQLKRDYLNLLKWTEPIALMLALVDEEDQALRVVKLAMDDVDLMLGSRFAGEVKPAFQVTTVGWINALNIPLLLKCQCWKASNSDQSISSLFTTLKILYDRKWKLQRDNRSWNQPPPISDIEIGTLAIDALGEIASESAISSLLNVLEQEDSFFRWHTVEVLVKLGRLEVIPVLLEMLEDNRDMRAAAEALVKLGRVEAIPGLLTALEEW